MPPQRSLKEFYQDSPVALPQETATGIGHFNVFEAQQFFKHKLVDKIMPYSRRDYYKIAWLRGTSVVEYADKVINVETSAMLFATPKIPYHWLPQDYDQTGMFCIFTPDFLSARKSGVVLEDLPIFQPGQLPVFQLSEQEITEIEYIFKKMQREINTDYKFKYDLLRNLVLELIHYGQKLQPMSALSDTQNASQRISSLFIELLERQFPIDSTRQRLTLRSPVDYADRLALHVNHLNKVLKEAIGSTTTHIIAKRITQEAKILLKQTNWSIAEIAYTLGFDDVAHFSNFFKKQTAISPIAFRA